MEKQKCKCGELIWPGLGHECEHTSRMSTSNDLPYCDSCGGRKMKIISSLTEEEYDRLIHMAKNHEKHAEWYDWLADRDVAKSLRDRDLSNAALLRRIADDLRKELRRIT